MGWRRFPQVDYEENESSCATVDTAEDEEEVNALVLSQEAADGEASVPTDDGKDDDERKFNSWLKETLEIKEKKEQGRARSEGSRRRASIAAAESFLELELGKDGGSKSGTSSDIDDSWLSGFLEGGYKKREEPKSEGLKLDFSVLDQICNKDAGSTVEESAETTLSTATAKFSDDCARPLTHEPVVQRQPSRLPKSPAALAQQMRNNALERYIQKHEGESENNDLDGSIHKGQRYNRSDGHRGKKSSRRRASMDFLGFAKPKLSRENSF